MLGSTRRGTGDMFIHYSPRLNVWDTLHKPGPRSTGTRPDAYRLASSAVSVFPGRDR